MDEFRIHDRYAGRTGREFSAEGGIQKYLPTGGRVETRAIDLGQESSGILRLEALGGRITLEGNRIHNEYAGRGEFRFADNSAVQFFMRAGDNPYRWTDADWRALTPGTDLPESLKGRYVQVAAVLYPSGDGETSPYLEEIRLLYRPNSPPRPPSQVTAVAADGAVVLSWKKSPDLDTSGYFVYYGTARNEYFGNDAALGDSPLDAGKRTSIRIEGLRNGTVYYFAIAAYKRDNPAGLRREDPGLHVGEFSREASARPLRAAE
jgi:hypothetical protein